MEFIVQDALKAAEEKQEEKTELKTLNDLENRNGYWILESELKTEAIKWVKDLIQDGIPENVKTSNWVKSFFGITDDDLKDKSEDKLKTLKEIEEYWTKITHKIVEPDAFIEEYSRAGLRQEAIEWVKTDLPDDVKVWIRTFFNLEESDINGK